MRLTLTFNLGFRTLPMITYCFASRLIAKMSSAFDSLFFCLFLPFSRLLLPFSAFFLPSPANQPFWVHISILDDPGKIVQSQEDFERFERPPKVPKRPWKAETLWNHVAQGFSQSLKTNPCFHNFWQSLLLKVHKALGTQCQNFLAFCQWANFSQQEIRCP